MNSPAPDHDAEAIVVPLPSPQGFRADVQRMVDFGARLPGYRGHDDFCAWMRSELVAAGLELIDCDEYTYDRWQPERVAQEVLGAGEPEPTTVATTYVRSASTSKDGVTGPLVDLGTMPTGSLFDALGGRLHLQRPARRRPRPPQGVDGALQDRRCAARRQPRAAGGGAGAAAQGRPPDPRGAAQDRLTAR